jgi:methylmalonyl-CoA mutase
MSSSNLWLFLWYCFFTSLSASKLPFLSNFDLIILETSGIGQSDTEILEHSDLSLYVMTPEYGAATQLEKIDMLDFADFISINKFDKKGSLDALRDVKKQYQRNNQRFDEDIDNMPVYGTIASQFNDPGANSLYKAIMDTFSKKELGDFNSKFEITDEMSEKIFVIPPNRIRYLSEISENNRAYDKWVTKQKTIAQKLYALQKSLDILSDSSDEVLKQIKKEYESLLLDLDPKNKILIDSWEEVQKKYKEKVFKFKVRNKELSIQTHIQTHIKTHI